MCGQGVIWLAVSGVSGRSELCSFHTVSFWSPSSSTLREFTQAAVENKVGRRGGGSGKTETNRWKRVNSSVCSLQCDMISYLGNRKCVMFSAGLKFTLTPAGTSSAAAQHSLYCKAVCCLHNKRSSQPECLSCVCVQWEGTVSPLGKALLRQENTWFRQPTIGYGAVKGHEYLREMFFVFVFLSHASSDESIFVIHFPGMSCHWNKNVMRSGKSWTVSSVISLRRAASSGGAICCFYCSH